MADQRATKLLHDWRAGDQAAADELMQLVYEELHTIASRVLRRERSDHTLRPTDLVSEAYVRLAGSDQPDWKDRVHFFAIAARNMRRALVEHARKRGAVKRGRGERPVPLDDVLGQDLVGVDHPGHLLALDEALDALAAEDERKARVVELHYFAGLTHPEVAEALGIHVNTVGRDLRFAEAWIRRRLDQPDP